MQFWLSDQTRLMALVALCALLWSIPEIDFRKLRYGLDGFEANAARTFENAVRELYARLMLVR